MNIKMHSSNISFPNATVEPFWTHFPPLLFERIFVGLSCYCSFSFTFHVSISLQMINLFYQMYFGGNLFSLLCWQDNTLVSPRSPLSIMPQWVNPLLIWLTLQVIYFSCRQFYVYLSFLFCSFRIKVAMSKYKCMIVFWIYIGIENCSFRSLRLLLLEREKMCRLWSRCHRMIWNQPSSVNSQSYKWCVCLILIIIKASSANCNLQGELYVCFGRIWNIQPKYNIS